MDSIGQSCALLPEEHGIVFPDGYYLATGELKRFESKEDPMALELRVESLSATGYKRRVNVKLCLALGLAALSASDRSRFSSSWE